MMQGIRALAAQGTRGAFGVREKPPRGGQRRKIQGSQRWENRRRRERQAGAAAASERAGVKRKRSKVPITRWVSTLEGK